MDNFDENLGRILRLSQHRDIRLVARTTNQVQKITAQVKDAARRKLGEMGIQILEEGALNCILHSVPEFTRFTGSTNNHTEQEKWKEHLRRISADDIEIMRQNIAALIRATVKEMFQNPAWLATPIDGEELFAPPAHAPAPSPATAGTHPGA